MAAANLLTLTALTVQLIMVEQMSKVGVFAIRRIISSKDQQSKDCRESYHGYCSVWDAVVDKQ